MHPLSSHTLYLKKKISSNPLTPDNCSSGGGQIALVGQDDSYDVRLAVSYSSNPQQNSDFEVLITAEAFREMDPGHTCIDVPDPDSGIAAGSNATLQITYIADFDQPDNQTFYACADITYVAAETFNSDVVPCFNATSDGDGDGGHGGDSGGATPTAVPTSDGGDGGLSGGAIAGIVIVVVVGVALLVAFAFLWFRREEKFKRMLGRERAARGVAYQPGAKPGKPSEDNSISLQPM